MEERKMTKAEEIQDSLEACRDIYRYYKDDSQRKSVHPARHTFRMEAYPQQEAGITRREERNIQLSDLLESDVVKESRSSVIKTVVGFLLCMVLAASAALLLNRYVLQPVAVEGISMEPNLSEREQLLMEKITYRFRDPERFDVVVFPFEEGVYYIKRIIGLPGEMVQIIDGKVHINGEPLADDQFGMESVENPGKAEEPIILGDNEYFLLGDNRNNSLDSRYEVVGNIKREEILGRVFLRYYPLAKFGLTEKGADNNDVHGAD